MRIDILTDFGRISCVLHGKGGRCYLGTRRSRALSPQDNTSKNSTTKEIIMPVLISSS
jgi:hypothetical protein